MSDDSQVHVSVGLVGIGGYGTSYVRALLEEGDRRGIKIVGAADPAPERCSALPQLRERGVRVFPDMDAMLEQVAPNLVVISAPIHLHAPLSVRALEHGCNVLCEKPMCATIQECRQMTEARDRSGRFLAIGYQWSFSSAVRSLKADIAAGLFGRPLRLKTLVMWPRDESYYARNQWAGRMRATDGQWILDSPASNATAHYLHNMFFMLGKKPDRSASPIQVQAELYVAKPTENFDTAAARFYTEDRVEIMFFTTHAVEQGTGPISIFEFEKASITYHHNKPPFAFRVVFKDGSAKSYLFDTAEEYRKLWDCAAALRAGPPPVCGPEAATPHILAVNGMHESIPNPKRFEPGLVRQSGQPGKQHIWAEGLFEIFSQCFEQNRLPSEADVPWATAGQIVPLSNYRSFPASS